MEESFLSKHYFEQRTKQKKNNEKNNHGFPYDVMHVCTQHDTCSKRCNWDTPLGFTYTTTVVIIRRQGCTLATWCLQLSPLHTIKKLKKKYRVNCDKMTSKKEWIKFISFFNSYSRIFICACSVIIICQYNTNQIFRTKLLQSKASMRHQFIHHSFLEGVGVHIPVIWIWKPIVSRIVKEHVPVGIFLLYLCLSSSLSQSQIIFVLFIAISSDLCCCFKAVLLVRILLYPSRASQWKSDYGRTPI